MTHSRAAPIFTPTVPGPLDVALATLTATLAAVARAVQFVPAFTEVHCPVCHEAIMAIPGPRVLFTVDLVARPCDRSGRGRVVRCFRCRKYAEVIEHGR